jgi:cbb3-type cytochrome oxidase subunit 3
MCRLLLILVYTMPLLAWGNAAAPHYTFPGGFQPLVFWQDSSLVQGVHLSKEQIHIQLFKNQAIVYGRYVFAGKGLAGRKLRLGYPVYESLGYNFDHYPNEPKQLRVQVNGQAVDTTWVSADDRLAKYGHALESGWYVWPATFGSDSLVCEVWFVVNTANALFRRGYEREQSWAFAYILSSGGVWHQPIGEGTILIKLMDSLTLRDVRGLSPAAFKFSVDRQWLRWQFRNLKPTMADNVLLRYNGEAAEQTAFSYDALEQHYAQLQSMAAQLPEAGWQPVKFDTHSLREVQPNLADRAGTAGLSIVFVLILYSPIWVPVLLVLLGLLWWYRRKKRKARQQ